MAITTLPSGTATTSIDPLEAVECWIFDLDNTLYPSTCRLFDQVDRRMGEFIARQLAITPEEARRLQKQYFREHGTTLRGLMTVHGMAPQDYLAYVHDIDLSPVEPSPNLEVALGRLAGRKFVFTNGSAAHAGRVLERLGVAHRFDGIFDVAAAGYVPKPDPVAYHRLLAHFGIDPARAAMVEDLSRNLAPARALGMTTVWLRGEHEWAAPGDDDDHVQHVIDDLAAWLSAVADAREARGAG